MSFHVIEVEPSAFAAAIDAGATFERFGVHVRHEVSFIRDAMVQTVAFHERVQHASPWGAYLTVDGGSREIVGVCGFKGAPNSLGEVEIAYGTLAPFEGKGCATAAAGALVRIAEESPSVHRVIAHTLPQRNASARVLEKNGFVLIGEVIDPEDGKVWRWERPPNRAAQKR